MLWMIESPTSVLEGLSNVGRSPTGVPKSRRLDGGLVERRAFRASARPSRARDPPPTLPSYNMPTTPTSTVLGALWGIRMRVSRKIRSGLSGHFAPFC